MMFTSRTSLLNYPAGLIVVCCLVLLCAVTAMGQSGRRGSKSPPVPVPAAEEDKKPEKKPESSVARIPLVIGASGNDVFTGIPSNIYDSVLQACAQRLDKAGSVRVEPVNRGLSRGEAIARAKNETAGYVVWLHLRGDDLNGSYGGNLDAIFIEYVVFENTTAKVRTSGNCYQGAYRKGGVVLGGPSTGSRSNSIIVEGRLRIAAEEAAERILKALHIASATDVPQQNSNQ